MAQDITTILLTIFVFVGIGYAAGRTRTMEPSLNRVFSRFVFYVSLPCLVLSLFGGQDVIGAITLNLLALNVVPLLVLVLLAYFIGSFFRLSGKMTSSIALALVMPSSTFVGVPVTAMMFGDSGNRYAVVIGVLHLVFTLLVAVPLISFLTEKKHEGFSKTAKRVLFHPVILALIAGIILNVLVFRLPQIIQSPLSGIGSSTTPIALFCVGLFMSGVKTNIKETKAAALIAFLRIIPYAALLFLLSGFLGVTGIPLAVSLLLSMMPVAVLSFVLSVEYGLDSEAMALGILITALLLPLPVYLVSHFV